MEIIKTTALITINETLWVQMIVFLIFLFLINRVMFRPVRRNIAERETYFDALRQDIVRLKEEMETLTRQATAETHLLKADARHIGDNLRQEGRREAKELMNQALDEIKILQREAEQNLRADMARARQQLAAASESLTRSIVQHFLNRRPSS